MRCREGRCYELSLRVLLDAKTSEDWLLVHGRGRGVGKKIGHAWLLRKGIVYDPVLDELMTVPEYERKFAAAGDICYTPWAGVPGPNRQLGRSFLRNEEERQAGR